MDNINDEQISAPVPPKHRSIFAILAGLFVIGFCLLYIAVIVASFLCPLTLSLGSLAGAPFTFLFAWLAYKQYSTLFCREPVVARAYHEVWFVIGVFMVVAAVLNALEDITRIPRDTDTLMFLGGMLVYGLLFLVIGWLLRRQTIRRQKLFVTTEQKFLTNQSGNKYWIRKIVGILLMSGCVCLLALYLVYSECQYPEIGEHVSYEQLPRKGGFPPEGSDFSWCRGFRGTSYYEFTVSEEAFRHWIASETRWEYCEPISESYTIPYSIHRHKDAEERTVTDGLYAGWGDGTGGRAVFDRSTNRAYYWTYY
ncbi:MAG: hypothetical protein FWC50_08745 [Planctomycetaceae bacterium]|nr:hypothetical protein [Planctomycetaceae bacterium]